MKRIASTVRTGWTEMSSRNENLLDELTVRMADERAAYVGRDRSPAAREYRKRQDSLLTTIRSEEHTSEPQSLMRISYAAFCLKKNNNHTTHHTQTTTTTTPT